MNKTKDRLVHFKNKGQKIYRYLTYSINKLAGLKSIVESISFD